MNKSVVLPNVSKLAQPVSSEETTFDKAEDFVILLSYVMFFLTFPIAILFCLKTATVFERIVIFRLGKIRPGGVKGPGLVFMLPCVDEYVIVDLRTRSFNVSPQEIITKDSVSIEVNAVVYYSVRNPLDAVIQISNARFATKLLAQATLRTVVGTKDLTELLTAKETLSKNVEILLDEATHNWGIKVERVEIKEIHLPLNMQRAMAAEQEAGREAQAKIIAADGELSASMNLKAASDVMVSNPLAIQLRYLQTLGTISTENNHTVILPFPSGIVRKLIISLRKSLDAETDADDNIYNKEKMSNWPETKLNKETETKLEEFATGFEQ